MSDYASIIMPASAGKRKPVLMSAPGRQPLWPHSWSAGRLRGGEPDGMTSVSATGVASAIVARSTRSPDCVRRRSARFMQSIARRFHRGQLTYRFRLQRPHRRTTCDRPYWWLNRPQGCAIGCTDVSGTCPCICWGRRPERRTSVWVLRDTCRTSTTPTHVTRSAIGVRCRTRAGPCEATIA